MAIKAKFAGKCARSGKGYNAGALIEKGERGWELVGGNATTTSGAKTVRIRMSNNVLRDLEVRADGRIKEPGVNGRSCYSGAAFEALGGDKGRVSAKAPDYLIEAQMRLDGARLVCPHTGEVKGVIEGSSTEYAEVILPKLHFCANGELSHKVGPEMWAKISKFFTYTSYADLADWNDQMDNFPEAEHYERMGRGGEWTLTNAADMPKVEEILGILLQNRRAEVAKREESERIEREAKMARCLLRGRVQLHQQRERDEVALRGDAGADRVR